MHRAIPAAAALPLLIALARGAATSRVVVDYLADTRIAIDVA